MVQAIKYYLCSKVLGPQPGKTDYLKSEVQLHTNQM